jgi:hypothetical protein
MLACVDVDYPTDKGPAVRIGETKAVLGAPQLDITSGTA